MLNNKRFLIVFLILILLPVAAITLGKANAHENTSAGEMKDTPETRMIEKCINNMDKLKSAEISIESSFYPSPERKLEISFDGLIALPGNLDGIVILKGPHFMLEGRSISINGKAWFLNPVEDRWEKSDPNEFHIRDENPLYTIPNLLWMISYFPEYLKDGLEHSEKFIDGLKTDCLRFNLDLDKFRNDADRVDQPDELVFLANVLSGNKAVAEIWIDGKTGYLAGLTVEIDEVVNNGNPVNVKIVLRNFNCDVDIKMPTFTK